MIAAMSELPEHLRCSITWDRGGEMANWRAIHLKLGPRSTSAIRIRPGNAAPTRTPTGCCGSGSKRHRPQRLHPADLKGIQDTLNRRPRPTLNLDTPAGQLAEVLDRLLLRPVHICCSDRLNSKPDGAFADFTLGAKKATAAR